MRLSADTSTLYSFNTMPTGLTSKIYLAGVPPGLTFEIISIKPVAPNDGYDWKASFRRGAGEASVSCIGQVRSPSPRCCTPH